MKKVKTLMMMLVGLVFIGGCMNRMNQPSQEAMIAELKKIEVVEAIETNLKNLDKDALTENGVIKTYEIDYSTVKKHPMGGIMFTIYVNGNKDLYKRNNLTKDTTTGKYKVSGGYSSELDNLLKEKYNGR